MIPTSAPPAPENWLRDPLVTRVRTYGLALCALIGTFSAWRHRHVMNPDGLSYLDLADAFARGDWREALNAYWSPLFPALLGVVFKALDAAQLQKFALAHGVIVALYLISLLAFDRFLVAAAPLVAGRSPQGARFRLSWIALGYAAFLWSSISLVTLELVTPDQFVAASVFGAAALAIHVVAAVKKGSDPFFLAASRKRGLTPFRAAVAMGVVLGVGYLVKTAMFPIAAFFLIGLVLAGGFTRRSVAAAATAALAFFVIAAPLAVALSWQRGRPTIGEAGRLNYAWFANGVTPYFHWQGSADAVNGQPIHPPRVICAVAPVYEFASPIGGTYPLWYDPAHWYDGVRVRWSWPAQARVLRTSAISVIRVLMAGLPLAAIVAAFGIGRGFAWPVVRHRELLAPFAAVVLTIVMYSFVEILDRLIAPALVLLLLLLVRAPGERPAARAAVAATVGAVALVALTLAPFFGVNLTTGTPPDLRDAEQQFEIADALAASGLRPGDRVGAVGDASAAYWAYLAGARVLVEAPDAARFFQLPRDERSRCLDRIWATGVTMLVSADATAPAVEGWRRVGSTNFTMLSRPARE